jgi:hypothetical protein
MPTKDSFSTATQVEIVDVLEDAREAYEADMQALGSGPGYGAAAHLAYVHGSVFYHFTDGSELSRGDLLIMHGALQRAYENCVELGLTDAADDYERADAEVVTFF